MYNSRRGGRNDGTLGDKVDTGDLDRTDKGESGNRICRTVNNYDLLGV